MKHETTCAKYPENEYTEGCVCTCTPAPQPELSKGNLAGGMSIYQCNTCKRIKGVKITDLCNGHESPEPQKEEGKCCCEDKDYPCPHTKVTERAFPVTPPQDEDEIWFNKQLSQARHDAFKEVGEFLEEYFNNLVAIPDPQATLENIQAGLKALSQKSHE